jgi:hypothetical protein
MNDELDLLQRATRALREETATSERRSGLTRARVLDGARARKRPLWRFLVPLVAVLGTSTAFARVAFPVETTALWRELVQPLRAAEPAPLKEKSVRAAREKPVAQAPAAAEAQPVVQATEPVIDAPQIEAPALAPSPIKLARKSVRATAPAPVVQAAPLTPASVVVESAELVLFRRAERLHRAQDTEAIAAWDAYLRVAPMGALVPEARYNRALALLRAGRREDARLALEPFAAGDFGGYRAREARTLIEQLAPTATRD